jgi:DNA-binding transcriptional regulator LsrR (DeoR family)
MATDRQRGRKPTALHHDRRNVEVAAWWWAESGVREFATIGRKFGVGGKEGRRLIDRAEELGILTSRLNLPPKRLGELRELAYVPELRERLHQVSGKVFQRIKVISGTRRGETKKQIERRLNHFAPGAALELSEWLEKCGRVGVAWGGTLSAVIGQMNAIGTRGRKSRIQVIPTCGEPLGFNASEDSSSRLAAGLALALNGDSPAPLSLAGVPALIPREFLDRDEIGVIRNLLNHAPAYRLIFGPLHPGNRDGTPLIKALDALITSVGWSRSRMAEREMRIVGKWTDRQRALLLGDIGGALLPRPNLSAAEKEEFARLTALTTGLRIEHLKHLARTARESAAQHTHGVPGVIVVTIGKGKASLTYEAIRLGLVNQLICDGELASALAECAAA